MEIQYIMCPPHGVAKIARARIGSAMPMMNENWSYSKHAEALIRIGACAATVIERDDGRSLFLQ